MCIFNNFFCIKKLFIKLHIYLFAYQVDKKNFFFNTKWPTTAICFCYFFLGAPRRDIWHPQFSTQNKTKKFSLIYIRIPREIRKEF